MSDSNNSLIVPFKNIINEAFLEDISTKTKSQLEIKRKNGEFVSNFAVYGYLKTKDKKLVPDDYAADIVKSIFDYKINGYNEGQIAELLNSKGVLSPSEYKKTSGIAYHTPFALKDKALWSVNAIKRIIKNRVYIGHLEQGKRTKASYRMTKFVYKPQDEWIVHENDHEPIVALSDFTLVQELAKDYIASRTDLVYGGEFADLGFSGTNFDRPGYGDMMAAIKRGDVKCVVVKDLSRLGRTYIEVGELLFDTFAEYGVRFISVTDQYDSFSEDAGRKKLLILFKNLVNHMYSKDLGKKIKSAHTAKQQRGELTGMPPYGYIRSSDGKSLEIEPASAEIVKMVFDMRQSGINGNKIVKHLNRSGVPFNIFACFYVVTAQS